MSEGKKLHVQGIGCNMQKQKAVLLWQCDVYSGSCLSYSRAPRFQVNEINGRWKPRKAWSVVMKTGLKILHIILEMTKRTVLISDMHVGRRHPLMEVE